MKPAGDSSHTYAQGECKHMTIAHRKGIHRKGHHPREPAKRADELPVQDSQAQLPDGTDLGAGEGAASSSAVGAAPPVEDRIVPYNPTANPPRADSEALIESSGMRPQAVNIHLTGLDLMSLIVSKT